MKKLLVMLTLVGAASAASAAVICQPVKGGSLCCWDTDVYGPWRPPFCEPVTKGNDKLLSRYL